MLPAYTVNAYLPCTGTREGYYNSDALVNWVEDELLPCLAPGLVVIMDNNSTHLHGRVRAAIERAGCTLEFLPPHSPD